MTLCSFLALPETIRVSNQSLFIPRKDTQKKKMINLKFPGEPKAPQLRFGTCASNLNNVFRTFCSWVCQSLLLYKLFVSSCLVCQAKIEEHQREPADPFYLPERAHFHPSAIVSMCWQVSTGPRGSRLSEEETRILGSSKPMEASAYRDRLGTHSPDIGRMEGVFQTRPKRCSQTSMNILNQRKVSISKGDQQTDGSRRS